MLTATPVEDAKAAARQLEGKARQAMHDAGPWVVRLGRFGLVAKGVVYLIVGALAIQAALGIGGGQITDRDGALRAVLRQPFGTTMLVVLAVGLLAYMAWRIVQAVTNPDREPQDFKGIAKRVFRLGSGLVYGAMGAAAVKLIMGMRMDDREPSDWTAIVMRQPFGKWMVAAAGLGVAAYGLMRMGTAWKGHLKKQLVLDRYAAPAREWITWLGRLGQAARGVVFVVIGGYLCVAAWQTDPEQAKGLGEVLRAIDRAPYGPFLLAAVAVGLIAYGLFQFVEARYRRIRAD